MASVCPMEVLLIFSVDVTCLDTYAPFHLALAGVEAGSVALKRVPHKDKILELGYGHQLSVMRLQSFLPFFFWLILANRLQTNQRNPGHIPFCYIVWLSS